MRKKIRKKILTTILGSTLLSVPASAMDTVEMETSHSPRKQTSGDAKVTLENHLNGTVLESSINELNEGKKGVCFIPLNFSQNEKNFLENLEVKIPANTPIGKDFSAQGCIFFTEQEKLSEDSALNKVTRELNRFFNENTNATELEKASGIINGPEFLTKVVLEYSEKLLNKFNATQPNQEKNNFLFISVKAFKPNDAFLNFFRWHYDGNVRPGVADLNFAGAFMGAPTVFAETADENRNILFSKVQTISDEGRSRNFSAEELIEKLTLMRNNYHQDTIEYKNINKEIDDVNKLELSNESNKEDIFRRLWTRMNLQALEKEKLISGIVQPKSREVALFTMNGENPALHSEPNIDVPRIFFGLRVYNSMRGSSYPMNPRIGDLSDPRTY